MSQGSDVIQSKYLIADPVQPLPLSHSPRVVCVHIIEMWSKYYLLRLMRTISSEDPSGRHLTNYSIFCWPRIQGREQINKWDGLTLNGNLGKYLSYNKLYPQPPPPTPSSTSNNKQKHLIILTHPHSFR